MFDEIRIRMIWNILCLVWLIKLVSWWTMSIELVDLRGEWESSMVSMTVAQQGDTQNKEKENENLEEDACLFRYDAR